jgi:hypothetical protein
MTHDVIVALAVLGVVGRFSGSYSCSWEHSPSPASEVRCRTVLSAVEGYELWLAFGAEDSSPDRARCPRRSCLAAKGRRLAGRIDDDRLVGKLRKQRERNHRSDCDQPTPCGLGESP